MRQPKRGFFSLSRPPDTIVQSLGGLQVIHAIGAIAASHTFQPMSVGEFNDLEISDAIRQKEQSKAWIGNPSGKDTLHEWKRAFPSTSQ